MRQILLSVMLFIFLLTGNNIIYAQTILLDDNKVPIEGFGLVKDPNSNRVYFGKTDSITNTAIYSAILSGDKLTAIQKSPILDNNSQETIPFFSSDGKYIFVFSNYENQNPKNLDLWFGKYNKGKIKDLKKAAIINTDSVEYYGSISAKGYIFFSSWRKSGYGKGDIFSARFRKGKIAVANHLGNSINNKFINSSPAISPQGDWFIFYNENENGADLYISFLKAEQWSKPVKLSNLVNTLNFEFAPVVGDNGKTLYFSRREKSFSSEKQVYHIYKISVDELELDKLKMAAVY